jgi:hypothetical protein
MLRKNPLNVHSVPYMHGELMEQLELGAPGVGGGGEREGGKGGGKAEEPFLDTKAGKKFRGQVANALKAGVAAGKFEKIKASFR